MVRADESKKNVIDTLPGTLESKEEEKPVVTDWKSSWIFSGPLYIPEDLKDPRFTYGWLDYPTPGRVAAAQSSGAEIDTEIKNKLNQGFDLPNRGPAAPIEGALIVGNSLLIRKPKELVKAQNKAEQDSIVEPQKAAKAGLKNKLLALGLSPEEVDQISIRGGIESKEVERPLV